MRQTYPVTSWGFYSSGFLLPPVVIPILEGPPTAPPASANWLVGLNCLADFYIRPMGGTGDWGGSLVIYGATNADLGFDVLDAIPFVHVTTLPVTPNPPVIVRGYPLSCWIARFSLNIYGIAAGTAVIQVIIKVRSM
jgi:hypothetical protein